MQTRQLGTAFAFVLLGWLLPSVADAVLPNWPRRSRGKMFNVNSVACQTSKQRKIAACWLCKREVAGRGSKLSGVENVGDELIRKEQNESGVLGDCKK